MTTGLKKKKELPVWSNAYTPELYGGGGGGRGLRGGGLVMRKNRKGTRQSSNFGGKHGVRKKKMTSARREFCGGGE